MDIRAHSGVRGLYRKGYGYSCRSLREEKLGRSAQNPWGITSHSDVGPSSSSSSSSTCVCSSPHKLKMSSFTDFIFFIFAIMLREKFLNRNSSYVFTSSPSAEGKENRE
ncbi:hypothetical protein POVWA2_052860 [Plasmodium ovale wallikeri]|uniref:Uncharacterized protein n=1 Tax=Plasmodium ovale wallikeri TaxID=864142 RepID=A0A1A8ZSL1_PLAOA|nr:hypothetical protein POVWA2_052860 [Plasmodium ovale wallikeri]